jgi:hypothetical protein
MLSLVNNEFRRTNISQPGRLYLYFLQLRFMQCDSAVHAPRSNPESIFRVIYFHPSERVPDEEAAALPSDWFGDYLSSVNLRGAAMKIAAFIRRKKGKKFVQAMRGNTRRWPGRAGPACAPRVLAGAVPPRAPRPKGALPLCGSPASELPGSDTIAPRVRPLEIRAQGALLPEAPAQQGDTPFAIPALATRLAEIPEWAGAITPFPIRARPRLRYRSFA